jgi:hypothetical protein
MPRANSKREDSGKAPAVCILYGFCEGPRMGGQFLRLLAINRYHIISDPRRADVLIAHSGGCFLVPVDTAARQIIMVGLTHWPGKSIVRALLEKNWNDFRYHRSERKAGAWLHKFSWNLVYFWNMPRNFHMLRARKRGDFWRAKHITLVRNREDSFCTPDIASLPFVHKPEYIELPDQHDDIWLHPDRYVDIINHYAKRLLA